jgi:hypothetical protein
MHGWRSVLHEIELLEQATPAGADLPPCACERRS